MARRIAIAEEALQEVLQAVKDVARRHPDGVAARQIADQLRADLPPRTLQYRLRLLVEAGHLITKGKTRWMRYRLASVAERGALMPREPEERAGTEAAMPLSKPSIEILRYLRQPLNQRNAVGYNRCFLDDYTPMTAPICLRESARSWRRAENKPTRRNHSCCSRRSWQKTAHGNKIYRSRRNQLEPTHRNS